MRDKSQELRVEGDGDDDENMLLNRLSRGSVSSLNGRLSGSRLSTTEFENSPHKLHSEINLTEASKWLDPYHPYNRAIILYY